MRSMRLSLGLVVLGTVLTVSWSVADTGALDPNTLANVVKEIENLNALRSGLAETLKGRAEPADKTTFKEVCKPVGKQAKHLVQTHGWKVTQMAEKYRNPAHQLDAAGRQAYRLFDTDPHLIGLWKRMEMAGQAGTRYFRRITVESACLACHGPKADRPAFIKKGYPEDRAYDFKAGDLRGIYSVFISDPK